MDNFVFELARTVRFCIDLTGQANDPAAAGRHNTFAGWPSMAGVGAYYEMDVVCRGKADPVTGYMMNISQIDKAVRQHALPIVTKAVHARSLIAPGTVLASILPALQPALGGAVHSIRWRLTPYYCVAMNAVAPDRVLISQQFEFAAAHRLQVDSLSAEQNRAIFGKCNNPNSHGHNYRIEPQVSTPLESGAGLTLPELEKIVDETIIQRFDHKHLNRDTAEFAKVNPSVENIARVCHDLLVQPIAQAGGVLERVRIWETEKTSCTYPAGE